MRTSRKRTVTNAELDPNTYVDNYLSQRGIEKTTTYNDSELERKVYQRAVDAREDFKRMRTRPNGPSIDPAVAAATGLGESVLTATEKYDRRLENNRKSAAASRVLKEVHMYETAYTLNQVIARSKQLEHESAINKNRADILEQENKEFRNEISTLRSKLDTAQVAQEPAPKKGTDNLDCAIQLINRENAALRARLEAARIDAYTPEDDDPSPVDNDIPVISEAIPVSVPVSSMPAAIMPVVPVFGGASSPPKMLSVSSSAAVLPSFVSPPLPNEARVLPSLFGASQDSQRYSQQHSQPSQSQEDEDEKPIQPGVPLRRSLPPLGADIRLGSMNSQDQPINLRSSMDFEASQNAVLFSQEIPSGRNSINVNDYQSDGADFLVSSLLAPPRLQSKQGVAAS